MTGLLPAEHFCPVVVLYFAVEIHPEITGVFGSVGVVGIDSGIEGIGEITPSQVKAFIFAFVIVPIYPVGLIPLSF